MLKNFLIGIPVRNFKNPMSRLENVLSVEKRIELSKGMFENIVKSFENEDTKIVCITNDEFVINYCKNNDIETFSSRKKGLNFELEEFLHSYEYEYWTICHADLPYLNNFYAQEWIKECKSSQIVICSSKDSGTPLLGGNIKIKKLMYGKNSFDNHMNIFLQENLDVKKSFNKEFSFEIDDEEDFISFLQHRPRWSKNLEF